MSSSVNPNQRSSLNNKVTRMESSNSVPSVVYTSRPVSIHGGTFHGVFLEAVLVAIAEASHQ